MTGDRDAILVAGAGIAGLTAALSFAAKGFDVHVFERAAALEEFGAGLQISPNASRILARLGVLNDLEKTACKPETIHLVNGQTGNLHAEMPLGAQAEQRWGAPYLVAHRADLHASLLHKAQKEPRINIATGITVKSAREFDGGVSVGLGSSGENETQTEFQHGRLLIGADGVWSALRENVRSQSASQFTGYVAWRTLVDFSKAQSVPGCGSADTVTAFLNPRFHLVAYPVKSGRLLNLVAVVKGSSLAERWVIDANISQLHDALAQSKLGVLPDIGADWTAWPLHEVDPTRAWHNGSNLVLIGDAAHAMTPFAAQGAAMAIEDAYVLADCVASRPDRLDTALNSFDTLRKSRVRRVMKRGSFNRFTWHASGPVAVVRNLVLKARSGSGLMRDFDWLYGYDATTSQ